MEVFMNLRAKFSEVFLDCGKLAFAVALASDILKGQDGEINFLLASGLAAILFLVGFVFYKISGKGGKNE
jgi:hypothetical protein